MEKESPSFQSATSFPRWALLSLLLMTCSCASQAFAQVSSQGVEPAAAELFGGLEWREVGPYRGGRSAACSGIVGDRQTYYFGSTGGGVWKTGDAGNSWTNISDGTFGGSIGAVAVSEWDPNVVWVGGGEKTVRGNVSHGDGVWRSDDAGKSWRHMGLGDSRHIPRIRIHPRDPDTAWVAALGHLFGPNEERGVYRTKDGGLTWERVLFVSPEVGCVDLALDPGNPRVLYASFWRVKRTPWSLDSGGEGSGIWKSTDGGDSWVELTQNPGMPAGPIGISGITVSPSNPENIYALVEAPEGGVFRSRDGGETWTKTNSERGLRQRAWYYTRIYADPKDEEMVYVLNVRMHRSKDGGKSFEQIATPHGDNHDLWIDPADPTRMIEANDGGVNVSADSGATWSRQSNQPTAQMYRVSVDDDTPYRLLGGQQDNSAVRVRSRSQGGSVIGLRDWEPTAGGESGHIAATPGNPDVVYGGSYGGYLMRMDHRTGVLRRVDVHPNDPMGSGAEDFTYRFQWNFPLFFSPHDGGTGARRLYAASNVLFASDDEGASWRPISPDLTRDDPAKQASSGGPITQDNTGVEYYCTIFAAFESPHQADVLWCGSDDGLIHLTTDGGTAWSNVTPTELPEWSQVNCLEPDPHNPAGAYLAATRYKLDDFEPYLFHTIDWGASWTRIDTGIPRDHFTRALRADPLRPGLLFAGTERGVYVSTNDGGSWSSLQLDLPLVPITDLAVKSGDLIAATQGRGFWILDDLGPLRQSAHNGFDAGQAMLFDPRPTPRLRIGRRDDPGDNGTNPMPGVLFTYSFPDGLDADVSLSLTILEQDGSVIRTYTRKAEEGEEQDPLPKHLLDDDRVLPAEQGLNRFAWDLRYPSAETREGVVLWNSDLSGPMAVPGKYRARLALGEEVLEVSFEVLLDHGSGATVADLRAQHDLHLAVRDTITDIHRGLGQVEAVRGEIEALKERAGEEAGELLAVADRLLEDLTTVEETLHQTKSESRQDPLNFPIRINDKLAGLMSHIDSGDFAPTAQARVVFEKLRGSAQGQLAILDRLLGQRVIELNEAAREIPAIGAHSDG